MGVSFLEREGGREKGMEGREMGRQDSTVLVWIVVAKRTEGTEVIHRNTQGVVGCCLFFHSKIG